MYGLDFLYLSVKSVGKIKPYKYTCTTVVACLSLVEAFSLLLPPLCLPPTLPRASNSNLQFSKTDRICLDENPAINLTLRIYYRSVREDEAVTSELRSSCGARFPIDSAA